MITVYTKNICPYCVKAKNYLDLQNIAYESINIEDDPAGRNFLVDQGLRSVPQLFVGKTLLVAGGANELVKLSKDQINEKVESIQGE